MDTFLQDLRYGVRALVKSPAITVIAALSLAIGIGANTTIFSAVDVFMVRPLPFPESERLAFVWTTNEERGWTTVSLSLLDALDYREWSETVDLAAYDGTTLNLAGAEEPERLMGLETTSNLFRVIGLQPGLGRAFLEEEEAAGRDRVAILSRGLWQRRFGGDRDVVGRTINLGGEAHTVVGVMTERVPDPFRDYDLFVPVGVTGEEPRSTRPYTAMARLEPGATIDQARAEFDRLAARLADAYPEANATNGANLVPLHEQLFDADFRQAALIVTVAVGFVLLIACANVANLLLARATRRERDMAVRAALGASGPRIARQLLTESVVLGLVGGALGIGVAVLGVKGLLAILPADIPRVDEIAIDFRVLAYLFGISVLSGLLVGLVPAVRAARPNLRDSLHEGGGGRSSGRRGGRARSGLAVAQISLALVLLISSTLLVRAFVELRSIDLNFRSENTLAFRTTLPESKYPEDDDLRRFFSTLVERVEALPGVVAAAAVSAYPSDDGYGSATYYNVEGREVEEGRRPVIAYRTVSPGYFETLEIGIVRGRGFTGSDREGATRVALINETTAENLWPDADPLGKRLIFSSGPREIVGVVEDHRAGGPDSNVGNMVYFPFEQSPRRSMAVVAHVQGDPTTLTPTIRNEIQAIDPGQPIFDVRTIEQAISADLGGSRVMMQVMGALAVIALLLALVGVYGVVSYSVAQRIHEMGLRMALGAQGRDVRRLVVLQGMKLAGLGVGIGLVISLGVTRALSTFLYGVSPFDPVTFAGIAGLILLAGLAAAFVPARRATRVDPMIALRAE